jgi:teichuronic acid biosynthesis glycosyltransferase TuaH
VAILVGHLNERLDLASLEAVVEAGVRLRVLGPRVDRDPKFGKRLKTLLGRSGVEWVGRIVPPEQVARELSSARVGLTPYLINSFNQASFPLKTFDYLAAGLPVVSTAIDASRWLATKHIRIADGPDEFARLVLDCIADPPSPVEVQDRQRLVREHGWPQRAAQMLRLAGVAID